MQQRLLWERCLRKRHKDGAPQPFILSPKIADPLALHNGFFAGPHRGNKIMAPTSGQVQRLGTGQGKIALFPRPFA